MAGLHDAAFRTDHWPTNVLEGHIATPAFDVQMHFTKWQRQGEAVFEPSMCFIEMFLSASKQVKGTYVPGLRPSDHLELGDISFVPEGVELFCSWVPGVQRSISCMFDIDKLSERAGMEWSWPGFDIAEALNIRNEYIGLGLRRVAEEVLSPGFASAVQIECSLLFVALELRRHLAGKSIAPEAAAGRLTSKQLALLRNMVANTAGAPPTIGELAASCGMGGRQLALAYRMTTGVTLRNFFATARLDRAKTLLLDGRTLIKQVAFDSGFQSSAAFTAAFRKATGKTPVEFRAAMSAPRLH
jgi:AraC family transcriptional regulator